MMRQHLKKKKFLFCFCHSLSLRFCLLSNLLRFSTSPRLKLLFDSPKTILLFGSSKYSRQKELFSIFKLSPATPVYTVAKRLLTLVKDNYVEVTGQAKARTTYLKVYFTFSAALCTKTWDFKKQQKSPAEIVQKIVYTVEVLFFRESLSRLIYEWHTYILASRVGAILFPPKETKFERKMFHVLGLHFLRDYNIKRCSQDSQSWIVIVVPLQKDRKKKFIDPISIHNLSFMPPLFQIQSLYVHLPSVLQLILRRSAKKWDKERRHLLLQRLDE